MPVYRTVVWDMDGVLVDSERHWSDTEDFFLKEALPDWDEFDESLLVGRSLSDVYTLLSRDYGLSMSEEEFHRKYNERAKEIYSEHAELMPNAEFVLQSLSGEGVRQVLASSSTHEWIGYAMERFGVDRYFELIVSADDVAGKGKPAPDIYEYVCHRIKEPKGRILVVEDSGPGMEAAHAAGLDVALYPSQGNSTEGRITEVEFLIHDLLEILLIQQGSEG